MKRNLKIAIIVALSALLFALPVAAMGGGNVKGEVTTIGADSFTMTSNKGETLTVYTPVGFDFTSIVVGDSVLVRGERDADEITASTIKVVGGDDEDETEEGEAEESEEAETESDGDGSLATNSAFCAEDKQDKPHPMAVSIAETYAVMEEEVIGYFCEGHSFGAIMLALVTSDIQGSAYGDVLTSRASGQGWGQIWKEASLFGNENDGASPPGVFHRPEHAGSGKPDNPGNPND
jgi:hypothetical protein